MPFFYRLVTLKMEAINSSEVRNELIVLVEGSSQLQGLQTLHLWKAKSLAF